MNTWYPGYPLNFVNAQQIAADASNIRGGDNPAFTIDDFLGMYPQFGAPLGDEAEPVIPTAVLQTYIDMALIVVQQARFRAMWKVAICNYIAHYCTLWLQTSCAPEDGADAIAQAAEVTGIITSETVDGISYSVDTSVFTEDLKGYAAFKTTLFGIQFATMAQTVSKGGMMIR